MFTLFTAEARLVEAPAEGATAEDFADSRTAGISTVPTQMRSVFTQTGARSQADPMRLVYSITR